MGKKYQRGKLDRGRGGGIKHMVITLIPLQNY
jgi:hypothetical protein